MARVEFNCRPTMIGSMPHRDPLAACRQVRHYLRDIPAWPQLPRRAFHENMYAQYSQGFPGITIEDERIWVERRRARDELEQFYADFLADDCYKYAIGAEYAAGLHTMLGSGGPAPWAVKGQVTGPVTWGLTVTDEDRKGILYDDTLGEAVPKLLKMKASWMEKVLGQLSGRTIIFLDEPYMSAFGSVGMMLSREQVVSLLDEVFEGIQGIKGVHCCGNTDWSIILQTRTDIISYDAYNYGETLAIYADEVRQFLAEGGTVAWGIVPNEAESLARETVSSLRDRLEETMAPFSRNGLPFRQVARQSLLTPSCGLAPLGSEEAAGQALELLADLAGQMRRKYT